MSRRARHVGSPRLFSGVAAIFALRRLLQWNGTACVLAYGLFSVASLVLLALVKTSGIPVFALQIGTAVIIEALLWWRRSRRVRYAALHAALALFGIAFFVWGLDISRTVCEPAFSHAVNGHVLWHLLSASCFVPY